MNHRFEQRELGVQIGKPSTVKVFYLFLTLWGLIGGATILAASLELQRI